MLYYVKNAKEFHQGEIIDFDQVGVKAISNKTLKVELHSPTAFFIKLLSHYSTYPVHKDTVLAYGSIDDRNSNQQTSKKDAKHISLFGGTRI